jgi:tetratricopeptide (TPR) repeat protein
MKILSTALLACTLSAAACSQAMHEPSPIAAYAPGQARGRSANELVAAGDAAWARRGEPGQAASAQGLYLDATVADKRRIDGLIGAMRAVTFRIEYEHGVPREKLAAMAVNLGQWCQRRAPLQPECDYRLAIALGQLARERTTVGMDAMSRMVTLLQRAIRAAPQLDSAGPHRVLALLLLRAPSWPVGPGDSEAALEHARSAVRLAPQTAANQLVLGEALSANNQERAARAAYAKAVELATAAHSMRDPEAMRSLADARAALTKTGG